MGGPTTTTPFETGERTKILPKHTGLPSFGVSQRQWGLDPARLLASSAQRILPHSHRTEVWTRAQLPSNKPEPQLTPAGSRWLSWLARLLLLWGLCLDRAHVYKSLVGIYVPCCFYVFSITSLFFG